MTKARTNADNVTADISGITAGTGITGGGTSGTVTITNDMATTIAAAGDLIYGTANDSYAALSIGTAGKVLKVNSGATAPEWAVDPTTDVVTTAGDLIYGTGADAVTRLGIGTASQYLAVNSGATAPEWVTLNAGGMTLISTTTLTGSSITLSSIPQTYNNLRLVVRNYRPSADAGLIMRINGDSASRYIATLNSSSNSSFGNSAMFIAENQQESSVASQFFSKVEIPDYTNTTTWKIAYRYGLGNGNTDPTYATGSFGTTVYNQTGAITSLVISPDGANFTSGTVLLYGVK